LQYKDLDLNDYVHITLIREVPSDILVCLSTTISMVIFVIFK